MTTKKKPLKQRKSTTQKRYISKKMVLEFPFYATLKTYLYFSNPPTHSKRHSDILHGNMNMDVAP